MLESLWAECVKGDISLALISDKGERKWVILVALRCCARFAAKTNIA